jgi:hypothetical protein
MMADAALRERVAGRIARVVESFRISCDVPQTDVKQIEGLRQ